MHSLKSFPIANLPRATLYGRFFVGMTKLACHELLMFPGVADFCWIRGPRLWDPWMPLHSPAAWGNATPARDETPSSLLMRMSTVMAFFFTHVSFTCLGDSCREKICTTNTVKCSSSESQVTGHLVRVPEEDPEHWTHQPVARSGNPVACEFLV